MFAPTPVYPNGKGGGILVAYDVSNSEAREALDADRRILILRPGGALEVAA